MQLTGNYKLKKPDGTDIININDLNDNADIIDSKLKQVEDHTASEDGSVHGIQAKIDTHALNKSNPHNVTRAQLQLEDVLQVNASSSFTIMLDDDGSLMAYKVDTDDVSSIQIEFPVGTQKATFHWSGQLSATSADTAMVDLLLDGVAIASKSFTGNGAGITHSQFDEVTSIVSVSSGVHTLAVANTSQGGSASAQCDRVVQVGVGVQFV